MSAKIHYSKNTVGCSVGGKIFIHPELYKHPKLYHAVVSHEKQHTDSWSSEDAKLDMFGVGLEDVKGDLYKFMLSHPRTLLGYLPITKVGKYWGFDLQMLVVWIIVLGVGHFVGSNI